MSNIHVPHLQTFYFLQPIGQMVCFPPDKHRTFFAVQDTDSQVLNFWLGSEPPVDIDMWFSLGGNTARDVYTFQRGIYGPIYMTEQGGTVEGEIFVISNLAEQPAIVPLPV